MKTFVAASLVFSVCFSVAPQALAAEPEATSAPAADATPEALQHVPEDALDAHTLPPVTVYGTSEQPPAVPVVTRFGTQFNVVTEEQISRQGALDFYDALRNVPGVMFQKKNIVGGQTSASLYIRGRGASHPSPDLHILFDDLPRSGVLYGQALADGIPVYALSGMEIYKYPQPSRFGSGYGMLNFIPKQMTAPGSEFKLGISAGSYETFLENIGAGLKSGPVDAYVAQSHLRTAGHLPHSGSKQTSYYLNAGYQLANNWSGRLMANHVDAHTKAPHNPLTKSKAYPQAFETKTTLVALGLANEYEKASGYFKSYYNSTNFHLIRESAEGGVGNATSKQSIDLYGFRARETLWLWKGSELVAGFDFDMMDLKSRQTRHDGGPNRVWNFPRVRLFSPYVALSQLFGSEEGFHATPSAGLRGFVNNNFANKVAPQAGLMLGYANTQLSLHYARGINYPSPVILQGFLGDTSLPPGFETKEIKPEVADHFEVGLTHSWKNIASLGATFFYDRGKDRIRAFMGGAAPEFFNSATARYEIRGMELFAQLVPIEGLEFFAGATWLKAKATGEDGVEQKNLPYTPSFSLQAGFQWQFFKSFQLSGDWQYLRNVYAANSMRTSGNFATLTDVHKLPHVNVANLRLDYLFDSALLHVQAGKIFLAFDNVFNANYAYAKAVNAEGTASANYNMPGRTFMAGFELTF